jgi:hypothetical protein
MSRRILFLLCPLLFAAATSLHAQRFPNDSFAWQDMSPPNYRPEPPWLAAKDATPRYPITVRLELDYNRYNGDGFSGGGEAHIFNPHGEDLQFKYRCGLTFPSHQPVEFYGRWVVPGRKLEILLQKPYTNRVRPCRISVSPPPSAVASAVRTSSP